MSDRAKVPDHQSTRHRRNLQEGIFVIATLLISVTTLQLYSSTR